LQKFFVALQQKSTNKKRDYSTSRKNYSATIV